MGATERRVHAMEEALRFYADNPDTGDRAREALRVDPWDSGPVGRATDYEEAVTEGVTPAAQTKVIDLMAALEASLAHIKRR